MIEKGKLDYIKAIDISYTVNLSELMLQRFIGLKGRNLEGLMVVGKQKLTEQFFLNVIPLTKRLKWICFFLYCYK